MKWFILIIMSIVLVNCAKYTKAVKDLEPKAKKVKKIKKFDLDKQKEWDEVKRGAHRSVKACKDGKSFCLINYVTTYDGDTFFIDIPRLHPIFSQRIGVRVRGIDTEEMRGGTPETKIQALKSKMFTKNMLENSKRIKLRNCSRGKYFRIVCDVYIDEVNLAEALLDAKLAVPY